MFLPACFLMSDSRLGWLNPACRCLAMPRGGQQGCGQAMGWRWALGSGSSLMAGPLAGHRRACGDAEMPKRASAKLLYAFGTVLFIQQRQGT